MQEDRIDWEELTFDVSWQLQYLPLKPGFKDSDDPNRFDAGDTYELRPLYKNLALVRPKTDKPRVVSIPVELAIEDLPGEPGTACCG